MEELNEEQLKQWQERNEEKFHTHNQLIQMTQEEKQKEVEIEGLLSRNMVHCVIFSRRILTKRARLLQWQVFFFFFRRTTECMRSGHFFYRTTELLDRLAETHLSAKGPPFVYSILNVRYKTGRDYRVPPLNFFRHCAIFFRIFLSPKGPPSSFLLFCSKLKFQKAQRVSPF